VALTRRTTSGGGDASVIAPPSRSHQAQGLYASLESGKFFPGTFAGRMDPVAPTDAPNNTPPLDGQIASAGNVAAFELDMPGSGWAKQAVTSGREVDITWSFTALRLTRRFAYFLTRDDWDCDQPLSRAQFEGQPFCTVENTEQPFWENQSALVPQNPTTHRLRLPRREGYQVLLAVWEVADTGNAIYQVIDLDFGNA
jgi:chitin-binding protein